MSQTQQTTAGDLAAVLSQDPVLAAKLLKLSNCALFGRRNEVTSLSRACMMLGFRAVRVWSLGFAVINTLGRKKPQGFDYEGYRTRSMIRAVVATILVQEKYPKLVDEAFTAALVSDIGEYVIAVCRPSDYQALALLRAASPLTADDECAILGYTTNDIGAEFLRKWGLPELICDAVQLIPHTDDDDSSPWRTSPPDSVEFLTEVLVLAQDFERLILGRFTAESLAGIRLRCIRLFGGSAHRSRGAALARLVECYLSLTDSADAAVRALDPESVFRHAVCQDLQARLHRFLDVLDSDPDGASDEGYGSQGHGLRQAHIWSPEDFNADKGLLTRDALGTLSDVASMMDAAAHVAIGYVAFGVPGRSALGEERADLELLADAALCTAPAESVVASCGDGSLAILLPNPDHRAMGRIEADIRLACERVSRECCTSARMAGSALWLSTDSASFRQALSASLESWGLHGISARRPAMQPPEEPLHLPLLSRPRPVHG